MSERRWRTALDWGLGVAAYGVLSYAMGWPPVFSQQSFLILLAGVMFRFSAMAKYA